MCGEGLPQQASLSPGGKSRSTPGPQGQTQTRPQHPNKADKLWLEEDNDWTAEEFDEDVEEWERTGPPRSTPSNNNDRTRLSIESEEGMTTTTAATTTDGADREKRSKHRNSNDPRTPEKSNQKGKERHGESKQSPPKPDPPEGKETRRKGPTSPPTLIDEADSRRRRKSEARKWPSAFLPQNPRGHESTAFIVNSIHNNNNNNPRANASDPGRREVADHDRRRGTQVKHGSLTKEDAAIVLQKMFRGSLGRRQGRKQALLTAWELLDYDDGRDASIRFPPPLG